MLALLLASKEMIDQIVRTVAKVEVLQFSHAKTEEGFVRLDADVARFRREQVENHASVLVGIDDVRNRTMAQDAVIQAFKDDFRAAVEREARADLVEKRKSSEADLEVALVKRSIERLRWDEEQKTVKLRAEEQRSTEDSSVMPGGLLQIGPTWGAQSRGGPGPPSQEELVPPRGVVRLVLGRRCGT